MKIIEEKIADSFFLERKSPGEWWQCLRTRRAQDPRGGGLAKTSITRVWSCLLPPKHGRMTGWADRTPTFTHRIYIYQRTPPRWIKSGLFSSFAQRIWGSMCDEARAMLSAAAERRRWINQYCPCVSLRHANDAHQRANWQLGEVNGN